MGRKAVIALSGGMDSTTLLAKVIDEGFNVVQAVSFKYGSKHNVHENKAAQDIADHYDIPLKEINLSNVFRSFDSALLASNEEEIPEGHYEAENMRKTVVPGRNLIFASILSGIAWSKKAEYMFLGIHAGDHFIYPDCRPEFAIAMAGAIQAGTDGAVEFHVPFIRYHKKDILRVGFDLKVPYELTRTCYTDNAIACGKCGSCQERLEAFQAIGQEDPIDYDSRDLIPKA